MEGGDGSGGRADGKQRRLLRGGLPTVEERPVRVPGAPVVIGGPVGGLPVDVVVEPVTVAAEEMVVESTAMVAVEETSAVVVTAVGETEAMGALAMIDEVVVVALPVAQVEEAMREVEPMTEGFAAELEAVMEEEEVVTEEEVVSMGVVLEEEPEAEGEVEARQPSRSRPQKRKATDQ